MTSRIIVLWARTGLAAQPLAPSSAGLGSPISGSDLTASGTLLKGDPRPGALLGATPELGPSGPQLPRMAHRGFTGSLDPFSLGLAHVFCDFQTPRASGPQDTWQGLH